MSFISRHFPSRPMTGLASICAFMTLVSWVGQRCVAELSAEHASNQVETANVRRQLDELHRSLNAKTALFDRETELTASVGAPPLSRTIAEIAAKLPADCCIERILMGPDQKAEIKIRCADVATFDVARCFNAGTCRINFRTVGDRSGAGFGWTPGRSAAGVFTVRPLPRPTDSQPGTRAD